MDDDDFLADADFDELESNAIAATQHQPNRHDSPASDYGFEDEDVIDLNEPHTDAPPPPPPKAQYRAQKPAAARPAVDEATAREQWRLQRFAQTTAGVRRPAAFQPAPQPITTSQTVSLASRSRASKAKAPVDSSQVQGLENQSLAELRARIEELETEKSALQHVADEAKAALYSKAGEIAIVRSNHDKAAKEFDRRLSAMQVQHEEEVARQKLELDTIRKDREKIETDKRFLEHDMAREAERMKRLDAQRARKDGPTVSTEREHTTPTKKSHRLHPLRDGFDDEEIVLISPSKSKDKQPTSKPSTPTKAGMKRKRVKTDQSPLKPLLFNGEDSVMNGVAAADSPAANGIGGSLSDATTAAVVTTASEPDSRFDFLQFVLNHYSESKKIRTIERLTALRYPSEQSLSIASLIYEQLQKNSDAENFHTEFFRNFLTIWERCLDEQYYEPLRDLVTLLSDIIFQDSASFSVSLMPAVVALAQRTADTVALHNATAHKTPTSVQPLAQAVKDAIDPIEYLDLLMLIAFNVATSDQLLAGFWKCVPFDFILLMLHKSQPMAHITGMLELFGTSILKSSFGAIANIPEAANDPNKPPLQDRYQNSTLDRLVNLLFEIPEPPADEIPYSRSELLQLRSKVLGLLKRMCFTRYGGNALASHTLVIGRLVRFLHDAILEMYEYNIESHEETVLHVNETVMLLAHLTSVHADAVDLRARLAVIQGGPQKHLVSLSRIAFSEGTTVLENGILPEVAEYAHRMLDEHLSPEEGEAVIEVFSSAKA